MKPREIAKRLETESGAVDFLAVINEGTQLSVLSKALGITALQTNLALLITDFANSYNVFTPMNDDQILDLAEEFAVEWWHYRLEDFVVFFQRAKKGMLRKIVETTEKQYYGGEWQVKKKIVDQGPFRITNRIDRGIILEMLEAYDRERADAIFKKESEPNQSISKERLNAEFSMADLGPIIRGEKTLNDILEEKRSGIVVAPEAKEPSVEDLKRAAEILDIQVKAFVDDIVSKKWKQRQWFMQPFSRGRESLIIAELNRRKSEGNE